MLTVSMPDGLGLGAALLEASTDCIELLDVDGRIVRISPAGCRLLELPSNDALNGKTWEEVWPDGARPMVRAAIHGALAGRAERFQAACPTFLGRSRWWDVSVTAISDSKQRVMWLLVVARDITEQKEVELALRAAEARQRLLLEAAQEGICTVDQLGVVTYANPRLGEILGARANELVGRVVFDALDESVLDRARTRFAARQQGAATTPEDLPARRLDGTPIWLRVTAGALTTVDGRIDGAVYLVSDVTAEHAAREDVARRERYFRALIERTSDLISVLDESGNIVYANPAYVEQLGYTPEEAMQLNGLTLVHPDDLPHVQVHMQRLLAAPDTVVTVEYRVIHRDGSERIVYSVARNLLHDEAVRGIVVNSRDITERRVAAGQRRKQAELLEGIFEHIPAMITLFAPDGQPLYANAEWERVTGWRRTERDDPDMLARLYPDPRVEAAAHDFIRGGRTGVWTEWHLRTRDGRTRETVWTRMRLSDRSIVCFGRDVTDERQLGAQLRQAQKMEAVGQLTAGIAHDFNNLLQVISGNAHFARDGVAPESSAAEDIAQIQAAAERAASLTRQLLAFSRQQVLNPEPVQLDGIVAEMENMLERTLGEHIALETLLAGGITVNADRHQLEQVIMNLAVNARDAMPEGGVLLIETHRVPSEGAGERAALVVRDTGIGMDEATRARIFEPFFTTKPVGVGTGLGLAMVHGIVHQSGGTIEVESRPGVGTAFTVLLPCAAPVAVASNPTSARTAVTGTETILLVEDDPAVRTTVRRVLERAGYTVMASVDGEEAIVRAARGDLDAIDLLITDAVMPGASAQDVVDALRSRRPALPVLVMSGHSADLIAVHRGTARAFDVLSKPFAPDELLHRVRAAIDARARQM